MSDTPALAMRDIFAERRARVLSALGADGVLIVAAAPELIIGADTEVRYLPSSNLYYLTGYTEPEAVLVLSPSAEHQYTLFVRARDAERELWTGVRGGVDAARAAFRADAARPIAELAAGLPALVAGATVVFTDMATGRPDVDAALRGLLAQGRRARARTGRGVHTVTDTDVLVAPLRLRKDAAELDAMRTAARITVQAFEDAARALPMARREYEIEAAIEYAFRRRGAQAPAFPTIAASGPRASVLHYTANSAALPADGMVLVDAGARADMYCADVSRTWPVSGRFTGEQRALYDVVLAAHSAAIACIAPGRSTADMEEMALRVLARGMVDLRLLSGAVDDIIEQRVYRRYFPHRLSHWLGLDVHDVGEYTSAGAPIRLDAGMVLTVEPGLYVPLDDTHAPAGLRGMAIRLEDDVLVTTTGADVLTAALPISPEGVEELIAG